MTKMKTKRAFLALTLALALLLSPLNFNALALTKNVKVNTEVEFAASIVNDLNSGLTPSKGTFPTGHVFNGQALLNYLSAAIPSIGGTGISYSYIDTTYEVKFNDDVTLANEAITAASAIVSTEITSGMSMKDKYKALHDWIVKNVTYDRAAAHQGQLAYDALVSKKAVCAGYTRAYLLLCQQAGLPCLMVTGIAGGEPHAWCLVNDGSGWTAVDVTWDDPTINGTQGHYSDKYFMITIDEMSQDHGIDPTMSYSDLTSVFYHLLSNFQPEVVPEGTPSPSPTPEPKPTTKPVQTLTPQESAQKLFDYGVFKGGSKGFELDRQASRAEALVMFGRLTGMTDTGAAALGVKHPFTDVPAWASAQIGYLYTMGYTKGASATTVAANTAINVEQYLTFVLRSLGYTEPQDFSYKTPQTLAKSIGIYTDEMETALKTRPFQRQDMVQISYKSIFVTPKSGTPSLYDSWVTSGKIKAA